MSDQQIIQPPTLLNKCILVWDAVLDAAAVREQLELLGGPLAVMAAGGGTVDLGPLAGLRVRSVRFAPELCGHWGKPATCIRLDGDAARLYAAWLVERPESYNWDLFTKQYRGDLAALAAKFWRDRLRSHPQPGLYAQVNVDSRVGPGEVGLHPHDWAQFLRQFAPETLAAHPDGSVGPPMYLQRYPVANYIEQAKVVLLSHRTSGKIYWNEKKLRDDAGGDEDGDGSALFTALPVADRVISNNRVATRRSGPPPDPRLAPGGGDPLLEQLAATWQPVTEEYVLGLVMGMLVKELTGTVTYLFWLLDRTLAVSRSKKAGKARERFAAFRQAYLEGCGLYAPLLELIMDAGKPPKPGEVKAGFSELKRLASACDAYLKGAKPPSIGELVSAFAEFMPPKDRPDFETSFTGLLRETSTSVAKVRGTAVGRLIAAGRKGESQERVMAEVLEHLAGLEVHPEEFADVLHGDAFGWELCPMPEPPLAKEWQRGPQRSPWDCAPSESLSVRGLLESLTYAGNPVFKVLRLEKDAGTGARYVEAWLTPHWKSGGKDRKCWRVRFQLPAWEQVGDWGSGDFRHFEVRCPSRRLVFFRPIFRWEAGEMREIGFGRFLQECLLAALAKISEQSIPRDTTEAGTLVGQRLETYLKDELTSGLPESSPAYSYVHAHKVVLDVPDQGSLVTNWEQRERALRWLMEQRDSEGRRVFGIGYTSKDRPGTEAAILGPHGFPEYALAFDPLVKFCQANPKRWAEYQYTDPQELAEGRPFPVVSAGITRPGCLVAHQGETWIEVVVADVADVTVFAQEDGTYACHDTGVTTIAGNERLALARHHEECATEERALQMKERLLRQRVPEEAITVRQIDREELPGLTHARWVVDAEYPRVDPGKVKSVPPFKFVPNVVHQPYFVYRHGERVEMHAIVARMTAEAKKALGALLLGLLAKAGVTEVEPDAGLPDLLAQIQAGLTEQGLPPDGRETVYWEDEDGMTQKLGRAYVLRLPFYRPSQTVASTFSVRDDISAELHAQLLAGICPDVESAGWREARAEAAEVFAAYTSVQNVTLTQVQKEGASL